MSIPVLDIIEPEVNHRIAEFELDLNVGGLEWKKMPCAKIENKKLSIKSPYLSVTGVQKGQDKGQMHQEMVMV